MSTLEIGMTQEELQAVVIEKAVERIVADVFDSDGPRGRLEDGLNARLSAMVDGSLDALVGPDVEAKVHERIDALTWQKTNMYGEKKGEGFTLREHLIERAEAYMTEDVDWDGKSHAEARRHGGSFNKRGPRIAYMIDKHLMHHIEQAMEGALKDANSKIAEGLNKAVRESIDEVRARLDKTSLQLKKR